MTPASPSPWRLCVDVSAADVDGDIVFLDVRHDTYVCLPGGAGDLGLRPGSRTVDVANADLAAELRAAGLIGRHADAPPPQPCPDPPRQSALKDAYPQPVPIDGVEMVSALLDLRLHYHRRPFHDIVAAVRRDRAAPPRVSAALLEAVDQFHRWSPYLPASGKCLLRSFVLARMLRRRGLDALWVFGVRTWPFHAHCWLQCEDLALDEQPDRIRAYTPILAV
ncbi:MAG: lasso peptide biosynthesis B2 protein [Phenylobacterium sp.]|uniref:lasso peptide biosynthesis B2 protein n=1 Tax=Phenylobacterium sp. TaxID=1871053 RepID=UPI0025F7FCF0|nr:lasso peptide biosynthesis B2 protein [Phenylobacterium sp.]MBI1196735.1 lasso peptide biosynthesis B2 protein [Phenylobacterium sp.]